MQFIRRRERPSRLAGDANPPGGTGSTAYLDEKCEKCANGLEGADRNQAYRPTASSMHESVEDVCSEEAARSSENDEATDSRGLVDLWERDGRQSRQDAEERDPKQPVDAGVCDDLAVRSSECPDQLAEGGKENRSRERVPRFDCEPPVVVVLVISKGDVFWEARGEGADEERGDGTAEDCGQVDQCEWYDGHLGGDARDDLAGEYSEEDEWWEHGERSEHDAQTQ